jgi:hypothetical protein
MGYQDKWLKGRVIQRGYRECANRYEIIRSFCAEFQAPFMVCDIGANWCYFGLRLTEDFEDCSVIAFEYNSYQRRMDLLRENDAKRVTLINRKLSIADLGQFSKCCRFDLVLGFSIIHHLSGPLGDRINALRSIGANLMVELALTDSRRVKSGEEVLDICESIPGCRILGYGSSHLDSDVSRPIILIPGLQNERSNQAQDHSVHQRMEA